MTLKFFQYFTLLLFLGGCRPIANDVALITIKGSDSMLHLTENLAKEYMSQNPGTSIYVYGGGTAEGVKALINGDVNICTASRNLLPEEAKSLADYYGTVGLFYLIAKDALCIYLNPENTVKDLSIKQLKSIFECELTNWKELGSRNEKILPVIRNLNSGTHLYVKEHILGGDNYCEDAVIKSTTLEVISFVEDNPNAIGYGSLGYSGNIELARIEGIIPSEKNVQSDLYPITRYLHFYVSRKPNTIVKNFIDWVLSPAGQKVIKRSGLIPLWDINN